MLAYCQSRLYVEYLIQAHGPESIAKLLNAYRGGQETAEALRAATGVDQATFEKGYVQFVESVLKPYLGEAGAAPTPARPVRPFDELQKAHQADPADADTAADLAEAYLRRDEPKKAKALVDTILQQQPTHAAATLVRARLLLRAGESEAAKASLEKLRANQPRNPRVLLMLARLYLESKEYEDAAEILEAGRRLAPLDGDWLPQLAQLYRETEQPEKLQGVLMELVDQDPDELKARLELAEMAAGRKDHPQAERFAREVLFIDVLHPTARELLITALELQGRADEATKIRNRYFTD
jgi:thioredoxin-like negative regulator of GroEL